MHPFVLYILKTIAISGLLFLYYTAFLRNRRLHTFNRWYILLSVVASLALPLLHFEWERISPAAGRRSIELLQAINTGIDEIAAPSAAITHIGIEAMSWLLYYGIVLYFIGATLWQIRKLYSLKKRLGAAVTANGVHIIETELDHAPFSFLNNMFWNTAIDKASITGQGIMKHELVHIQQHHTLDKLFTRAILSFFWMNPFFWLFQNELSMVHEYIADEHANDERDMDLFAQMLLQSHFGRNYPSIIQPFFYSPIKKRIAMLQKTNRPSYAVARKLLALPLLTASVLLFSFSVKERPIERSAYKTLIVVDAGHGGDDMGASANGVVEKDMNLKIARKLAQMAPNYNIGVIYTRDNDKTLTLDERVKTSTGSAAKVFVSVHVSKNTAEDGQHRGFEVYVSQKSPRYQQSQVLASAIAGQLKTLQAPVKLMDKGLHVLKANTIPGVLIECGNLDTNEDMARLQNDQKLEELCGKILSGIANYVNEQK